MRIFGLLGKTLSHSFSKDYFTRKFEKENIIDVNYQNFELANIDLFNSLIRENSDQLSGVNVTTPYKEAIIPFLDELDNVAKQVGAVNTIQFQEDGKLKGYNTDVVGFRNSIKPFLDPNHSRALIFGTGGAAKAIAYVLDDLQIPYYFVSRKASNEKTIEYKDLDRSSISSFRFLINCTPLGTFPAIDEMIPIDVDGIGENHLVYDLIYNPKQSLLLKEAGNRGAITVNGLSMLRLQAEASWKIWN